MNGRVGAESEAGRGSSFWLELPLVESSPEGDALTGDSSALTPTAPSAPVLDNACTILCIEDNLSNLELIKQVLNDLSGPIRFLPAMQGSVGLDIAKSHHPDLILLDVNLPDIMGDVVLSRLKANPVTQEIPVIVLSADATPRQIDRLLNAGAAHYLTKPLDIELFLNILKETLKTTNLR